MGLWKLLALGLAYVIHRYHTIVRHRDFLFLHHRLAVFVLDGFAGVRVFLGNALFDCVEFRGYDFQSGFALFSGAFKFRLPFP